MNPAISTLLTVLQWAGYLAVFTYVVFLLTWAIGKVAHDYFAYKTAFVKMSSDRAPERADVFQAAMDARNGKHPARDEQKVP